MQHHILHSTEIPSELFVEYFCESIEVLFAWSQFLKERWPVSLTVTSNIETVSKWYMPWNINEAGAIVPYDVANARPVRVAAMTTIFSSLDLRRQERIQQIRYAQSAFRPPVQFAVPTYDLGNGELFLLDGNHRVASLVLNLVPFRLLTFTLHGPLAASIFPELRHWEVRSSNGGSGDDV